VTAKNPAFGFVEGAMRGNMKLSEIGSYHTPFFLKKNVFSDPTLNATATSAVR